jgi:hypothetical protein
MEPEMMSMVGCIRLKNQVCSVKEIGKRGEEKKKRRRKFLAKPAKG